MDESEIQELAASPQEIGVARKGGHLQLVLNVVCILVILWMARDWLMQAANWLDGHYKKDIARRLGISSGAFGIVWYLIHTAWQLFHASTKKKQKSAEDEKKQFNPHYNPIAARDSESWSHERHHD
jgi:threonine/homoserine/homoserine lactone efflux protein